VRSGLTWAIYAVCVLLVIDGLGWLTFRAVQAERSREEARATVLHQQQVQLALWRMDSALARLLRNEAGRSPRAYLPFPDPQRPDEPSPLLAGAQPPLKLHFAWTPSMGWSSPQAPTGDDRARAMRMGIDAARLAVAERSLIELRERMPSDPRSTVVDQIAALARAAPQDAGLRARLEAATIEPSRQIDADAEPGAASRDDAIFEELTQGPLRARWLSDDGHNSQAATLVEPALVLMRDTVLGDEPAVVGVWIDWPSLQATLTGEVADLLPSATLSPLNDADAPAIDRLALIPARVVAPMLGFENDTLTSSAWMAIGLSWAAVLAAVLAVGVVLRQALLLSDRRAKFASAVSHELRTPLTSLRLQADLMDQSEPRAGVVREQVKRLEAIVESVLAYAGVRRAVALEPLELQALLRTMVPDLRAQLERAGGELIAEPAPRGIRVLADQTLLRRVLGNLVDNACAHARSERTLRVELRIQTDEAVGTRWVHMWVVDNGPGIPRSQRRRIFRAFVGGQSGGLGLGLALARSAAGLMGGKLTVADQQQGAAFVLRLQRVPNTQCAVDGATQDA
jgi:signal transduction histidine kinase